mmetsp:Transcript_20997/g.27082  ORF Transcript_20997/g.27082 Transcript_20997/m.27082 type:complete len:131 (+) Transcript_20997:150-542(+)
MTYRSRGRSLLELIFAVSCVAFLCGFILVLCIGNYFRARRAMELQRQRRLAKHANSINNNGVTVEQRRQHQPDYEHLNGQHSSEQDSLIKSGRGSLQQRRGTANVSNQNQLVNTTTSNTNFTAEMDQMSV